jgi:glycosyltransferase 2 family protein
MQWLKRHRYKVAISLVSACAFFWLLQIARLPLLPDDRALARCEWWALPMYIVVWSGVHVIRAARWQLLLSPLANVPMRKILCVSFIGFAAIVLLPLRTGEVVRPALIREEGRLSGWSAIGTVGAERVIDGLFLACLLWFGLLTSHPLSPLPDTIGELEISPRVVSTTAYGALVLFGCAMVAMAAFYFARDFTRRMVMLTLGRFSPRLAEWMSLRVEKVSNGLSFLPRPKNTLLFVLLTSVYWIVNAYSTCWLADGVGLPELDFAQACVVTGVLALGIMVPNAPGFLGAFQFSVFAALSLFYPPDALFDRGAGLVFLLFLGQTIVTLGAGVLGALWMHISFSSALGSSDEPLEG